ncbi:hypothetical protein SO802_015720 [Lithocarpus litseifolius]|uniref:Uncharacterized protein n=1 Tax=Lithocarpus litseifolius TaxID=425828 RepID=A0AAW2CVS3_9ROSI
MRSMKGEVVLNIPTEKAWEMYRDNEVISKINPEMLARAEYIQGDGNPGSLRLLSLAPAAISNYVKESTEKIEKVEMGQSVTYSVIGGDLRRITIHIGSPSHSFLWKEKRMRCVSLDGRLSLSHSFQKRLHH